MITVALRLSLVSGPWSKCRENNPVNSVLECSGAVVLGNAEMGRFIQRSAADV